MAPFEIGRLFHLTHVVSDLDAVDRWYDEVFSVTRFYNGYEELAGRDASLVAISDLVLEPMAPARGRELKNPSVQRFQDRFGQHFHSIAWYVDDVEAISHRLDQHGLRLFNIVGRQVAPNDRTAAIWTHPKETFGQLEFATYADYIADPRFDPGWSAARWQRAPARHPRHLAHRRRRTRSRRGHAPVLRRARWSGVPRGGGARPQAQRLRRRR